MANVDVAIDFVLRQEDAALSGDVTTLKGDSGGATRFGLASADHPELVAEGFYDKTRVSRDQALQIAQQVYSAKYAAPLRVADISDQACATAVLSLGINSGPHEAGEALQKACVVLGHTVSVDGEIGTETLTAANACDPDRLLAEFSEQADEFYRGLAADNASYRPFLHGWEDRVAAWSQQAAALRAQAS